jgi:hypothetical protein
MSTTTIDSIEVLINRLYMAVKKNPLGMTRDEAKKAYFRFRSKKEDTPESSGEDQEQKINRILLYMNETTVKLDRIEEDISFLKEQVGTIIKKL